MIANPNSTPATMKRAIAHTITALAIAAEVDLDRSDEDRSFFAAKRPALEQLLDRLTEAMQELETFNLREGIQNQLRVELGDSVLDRSVSKAKAWLKVALRDKSPESANYVFGNDLRRIIHAEIKAEPYLVLECLQRLATEPEFEGKERMAADLEKRAKLQIANLQARDMGRLKRSELTSKLVRMVAEAANALYQLNHELLMRFPREREYVAEFFWDVSSKRRQDDEEPIEEKSQEA